MYCNTHRKHCCLVKNMYCNNSFQIIFWSFRMSGSHVWKRGGNYLFCKGPTYFLFTTKTMFQPNLFDSDLIFWLGCWYIYCKGMRFLVLRLRLSKSHANNLRDLISNSNKVRFSNSGGSSNSTCLVEPFLRPLRSKDIITTSNLEN